MTNASILSPAWNRLHHSLLEARSRVQSAQVIQQINRSLLAGENVSAAFYDLSQLKQLQLRKALPLLTIKAEEEIGHYLAQIAAFMPEVIDVAEQFADLQRQVAAYSGAYHWRHASLPLVQHALFNQAWHCWQEVVETLCRCEDSQGIYARLESVLGDSVRIMAVLGNTADLFAIVQQLRVSSSERAAKCRISPDRLTDFIAAADIATRGIVIFDTTAEAVLRGRPLPGSPQLDARIKAHHLQVIERTHPWFTAL